MAWIGPTPWLLLARAPRLPGRRPYLALWLAGAAFWLAAIQWIRLPYPANIVFLFLLAFYLGAYPPVFVGLTRVALRRLRAPLWLAGAIVWTGLEWVRAHLMTGFLMASLAHTQVKLSSVIQIADLVGEYGVTFLIVLVAGSIASALPLRWADPFAAATDDQRLTRRPALAALVQLIPAVLALTGTIGYAYQTFRRDPMTARTDLALVRTTRIALVQSDMLADWKGTPERDAESMDQQLALSVSAVKESSRPINLVVWPETMFRQPLFVRDAKNPPRPGAIRESNFTAAIDDLRAAAKRIGAPLLVGIDRVLASDGATAGEEPDYQLMVYNSAAFVDHKGDIQGTYDKMHLLPFGEFIPFAEWVPFLAKYAPISGDSLWGAGPAAFALDGFTYAPNICYETVLPHLIRRQVIELSDRGEMPDVLVNLTNDAWYWGSSELDMHLASGVFRAVEMRTPLVIAANRGLSAYIDFLGRVDAATQRDRADVLVVDVQLPTHSGVYPSFYAKWGDWLAVSCLVCCVVLAVVGWRRPPA